MDETGISMDEAMDTLRSEAGMSERIAVMKGMERSKFDRVGDMIVAVSHGGSVEASVCKALLGAGAEVVFVGSQKDDMFRLSARASQKMVRRGIHLGEIMKNIGEETITDGGGHGGAAGLSGIGDTEAMLHICMQRTMSEFRNMKKRDSEPS
jgi:nanoRNase/pAp phosphatase (c-di-AMP/oligoRNAs hydrolase)